MCDLQPLLFFCCAQMASDLGYQNYLAYKKREKEDREADYLRSKQYHSEWAGEHLPFLFFVAVLMCILASFLLTSYNDFFRGMGIVFGAASGCLFFVCVVLLMLWAKIEF